MIVQAQKLTLVFGLALFSVGVLDAPALAGGPKEPSPKPAPAGKAKPEAPQSNQQPTPSEVLPVAKNEPAAPAQKDQRPSPEGLKGVPIPTPSNLGEFIADRNAAIVLGKALFWDMQVGSDGVQACASCHFHAGTDNRSKNTLNPGLARASSPTTAAPDYSFQLGGPNYQLSRNDFPFVQFDKPDNSNSWMIRDINDVVGSQGVTLTRFASADPGASADRRDVVSDRIFNVGGANTRRVSDRNTPSTINAVFNFRNFWDGRAQFLFNGVNPFGARDESARVFKTVGNFVTPVRVLIDNASLASQAVGPPSSNFEMSADGRTLMDIGRRLLPARPLAGQRVAPDDSVLGRVANGQGSGLAVQNYAELVRAAFRPEWWNGAQMVEVRAGGEKRVIDGNEPLAGERYNHMEANFSLFFGLAVQMYESTLVSDDAPFDRYMAGDAWAMSKEQKQGMDLFFGKGKCANCHGGAEFTNASVRKTLNEPLQRMKMGDGKTAVYDEGFYNTAVTRTSDDILLGGRDAFGRPLSNTALIQQIGPSAFREMVGVSPNIMVNPGERIAVMGAAKTPTVRNAELTQPFFHNGGDLNLDQLMSFYNRGGNFPRFNKDDLDADIESLKLSDKDKSKIIAFMKALTDERVRRESAPFDHPELRIPSGHVGNASTVATAVAWDKLTARDDLITLPAVGASGGAGSPAQRNFLDVTE
ncbi:cytochrome-c peroxidase [Methylocystis echinoides]|uniref:Cytochrome c domain-containing protein n=1 Tax=Methylocystis echinoides TaxID=29468 RepID=A0A9W6LRQ3_9HYPH|nr:cytochrome c peroxidase [Methylocystis echinoides]GLI92855.1 hypothetical protein LMG27198_18470 [Methylocystis echinoides]